MIKKHGLIMNANQLYTSAKLNNKVNTYYVREELFPPFIN